jgi:spore maturation protein CgeB
MNVAFFGSSLTSAYWNGAATYYRGIIRALHERGHRVTFYEPDAYERQRHRDMPDPPWAEVVVYPAEEGAALREVERARGADLVVKASGVGVFDDLLEAAVLDLRGPETLVAFWDVDAPATLDRLRRDAGDPFRALVPRFDLVLTYGGGDPVVAAYAALGARGCYPIYNGVDPDTHHPVPPDPAFEGTLAFLGNRLPDREARVDAFFLGVAESMPACRFLLGGSGWDDKPLPANVHYLGHVYTRDHNALNRTPTAVLNVSRDSMAAMGYSPATRVFEAAAAEACLVTDAWEGVERFFEPDREILVARSGGEVAEHLRALDPARARAIGARAHARALAEHTYARRALAVERAVGGHAPRRAAAVAGHAVGGHAPRSHATVAGPAPTASRPLRIAILGLTITSSWGNGHATTYRGLVRELEARGHDVTFLERDVPWYAGQRDLPRPPYGRTELYADLADLQRRFGALVRGADAVIVGSYVPEGVAVGTWVTGVATGLTAFYDIDTPITLARLRDGGIDYLAPELVPRYGLYLSFTGGPTLERLEREFGAPRARPLYCSVDPDVHRPDGGEPRWDLGYLGTYSADRQPGLERLMLDVARSEPGRRFVVAGPQYPATVAWPGNVERIEHVPPERHPWFYGAQRFTLNLTRDDMKRAGYAPSVRLFEAAACGVPVVSDAWPGLETFFVPGSEVLVSDGPAATRRLLLELPEEERRAVGARARRAVLARHTSAHRAAELETHLREAM